MQIIGDYFILIEALSSCAIEGNKYAIEMLRLEKEDPKKFWIEVCQRGWIDYKPKKKREKNNDNL